MGPKNGTRKMAKCAGTPNSYTTVNRGQPTNLHNSAFCTKKRELFPLVFARFSYIPTNNAFSRPPNYLKVSQAAKKRRKKIRAKIENSETQRIVQNAIGPSFDHIIIILVHLFSGNMFKYQTRHLAVCLQL